MKCTILYLCDKERYNKKRVLLFFPLCLMSCSVLIRVLRNLLCLSLQFLITFLQFFHEGARKLLLNSLNLMSVSCHTAWTYVPFKWMVPLELCARELPLDLKEFWENPHDSVIVQISFILPKFDFCGYRWGSPFSFFINCIWPAVADFAFVN